MSGSTINNDLFSGVTLGAGGYTSPLTITSTGGITGASVITGEGPGPRPSVTSYGKVALQSDIAGSYVLNQGTIAGGYGTEFGGDGVILNGGTLTNQGTVSGGGSQTDGGVGASITGSLQNFGTIQGEGGNAGVSLTGALINEGLIQGGAGYASSTGGGSFSLAAGAGLIIQGNGTNAGTIIGGDGVGTLGQGGNGLELHAGTFTNTGIIIGGAYGTSAAGASVSGLLINNGTIMSELARYGDAGGNNGVNLAAGTVLNNGTITCDDNGLAANIYQGTFFNNGMIAGAVFLAAPAALIVDPGATFTGAVTGAGGDSLELAIGNGATGTLDMGGSFSGFGTVAFDAGALWTLGGTTAELADGETITGFTLNDTLVLDGFAATSDTYVAGTGLELSDGVITETLGIAGAVGTFTFAVSNQSGNSTIALTNPPHTISTTVTTSVTLGSVYLSPLTITATGDIAPAAPGATGVYAATGSVTNNGVIAGAQGAARTGPPQAGGIGVDLADATLLNAGIVTGGQGGGGGPGGGAGGDGAYLNGGALINSGTIIGGTGAVDGGSGGTGGYGLYSVTGTVTNSGTIIGGQGGAAMYGRSGYRAGAGMLLKAGLFTNTGTIIGGASDAALQPGPNGVGLIISGGSAENQGLIEGGSGGKYQSGGIGADLSGDLTNGGRITGGASSYTGGLAISILDGTLVNQSSGEIIGGTGVQLGGGAMEISGAGIIENYGLIAGGAGSTAGHAVYVFAGSLMNAGVVTGGLSLEVFSLANYSNVTNIGSIAGGVFVGAGHLHNMAGGTISGGITISALGLPARVDNAGQIVANADAPGAFVYNGTLINTGGVTGGDDGGDAVVIGGRGYLNNSGQISGGASHYGSAPTSPGGIGVDLTYVGTIDNSGTILGGNGGVHDSGGDGIFLHVATGNNSGLIEGGSGSIGGSAVYLSDATFTNAGTVEAGQGVTPGDAVSLGNDSTLVADPGAVFDGAVVANFNFNDELDLGAGPSGAVGTLDMGGSFTGFSTIVFDVNAAWSLAGTTAELATGQKIAGFTSQDSILLENFAATSHTYVNGIGLELSNGVTTETLNVFGGFLASSLLITDTAAGTKITLEPPLCYLRGTHILTPAGDVAIETLNIGDTVITRYNGYRRIKWIGRQSFGRRFIQTNRAQLPIRFAAGALGPLLPKRDLHVSPGHSMLIGNVLVVASSLINGVTITQSGCPEEVHYYQLEFETHDCVQAEGCWSESFCDYANLRNQFHNIADFNSLFPNHVTPAAHLMCAPRPEHGALLEAALRPIVARATAFVPPGPLQGWIDHIHPSGVITGWAQDTAHPELPVLLEILLGGRVLDAILAGDYRADLAAAGIGQGRAAFAYKSPAKLPRAALPRLQIRRVADRAILPIADHCLSAFNPVSQTRRKRA